MASLMDTVQTLLEGQQLHSAVCSDGLLRLSLAPVSIPALGEGEVLVHMQASPIHPADIMVLLAGADVASAHKTMDGGLAMALPPTAFAAAQERLDVPLALGLEGAGRVVAAGAGASVWAGKRVAVSMPSLGSFAQYAVVPVEHCLELPDHIRFIEGAAAFTNPLTALAMIETLHQIGERAVIHTAAASHIGQMLVRLCAQEGIALVNIVRKEEHIDLLRSIGAQYVCNMHAPDYVEQLADAVLATGAKVAFDAIGGGTGASRLLRAMEVAACAREERPSPYGSSVMKRVYLYGRLDAGATMIPRGSYGMQWSIEGWAMPPILARAGKQRQAVLRQKIAQGLDTTFACSFGRQITLSQMLEPDVLQAIIRQGTAGKHVIVFDPCEQH